MIDLLGWTGAMLFSFCALPQCIKTWRSKEADDLSWIFLLMWLWGEILTLIYVLITNTKTGEYQWPLLANYVFNLVLVGYLLYAKWKYRSPKPSNPS